MIEGFPKDYSIVIPARTVWDIWERIRVLDEWLNWGCARASAATRASDYIDHESGAAGRTATLLGTLLEGEA
jgi:hypothetical protein